MSNPEGDAHSKSSIIIVAACMATMPTSIHEAVSNGSENALLDAKVNSILSYIFIVYFRAVMIRTKLLLL